MSHDNNVNNGHFYFKNFSNYFSKHLLNMSSRSRSTFSDYFKPTLLTYKRLPTFVDAYLHYSFIKCGILLHKDAVMQTADRICDVWFRSSLPTFDLPYIRTKLIKYIDNTNKLKKNAFRPNFPTIYSNHIDAFDILFDICPCKCVNSCQCKGQSRVPAKEFNFLADQRTDKVLCVDTSSTSVTSIQSRRKSSSSNLDTKRPRIEPIR